MRRPSPRALLASSALLVIAGAFSLTPAWLAIALVGSSVQRIPFGRGTVRTGARHAGAPADPGWYWTSTGNWLLTSLSATVTRLSELETAFPRGARPGAWAWNTQPPWWSISHGSAALANAPLGALVAETAGGWPVRCLVMIEASSVALTNEAGKLAAPEWLRVPCSPPTAISANVQVRVLWRGLLADTILLVTAALVVNRAHRLWRHSARRRRGACLDCGYDRTMLADKGIPCPECGAISTP